MARSCAICEKKTQTGHNVSHSQRKTNRVWLPNLQRIKILKNGAPTRTYVCTNCIKSGRVERAL